MPDRPVRPKPTGDQATARFRVDMVAAVVSMVVRFRRSRAVERQQLKWFTYAGRRSCRFWCWSISSECRRALRRLWIVLGLCHACRAAAGGDVQYVLPAANGDGLPEWLADQPDAHRRAYSAGYPGLLPAAA
jgi:hypothetical protein